MTDAHVARARRQRTASSHAESERRCVDILLAALALCCLVTGCADSDENAGDALAGDFELAALAGQTSCSVSEIVSPAEFDTTERGAFTDDGRFFFIGTRPASSKQAGSWIAELEREEASYRVVNHVFGTLEGTRDGKIGGPPAGDACTFSGMASHGSLLYAGCVAPDQRVSFVQVDTARQTVRAGVFTTCNLEPAQRSCKPSVLYPNGMAVDGAGRIYASNTGAFLLGDGAAPTLLQIAVDPHPAEPDKLSFRHRTFLASNLLADGIAPNGVQIKGNQLYFAAGANLNAVTLGADGSAGPLRVHYRGPLLSYIDDFALQDGSFVLARTLPAAVGFLEPARRGLRQVGQCALPHGATPSSVTVQPALAAEASVFAPDTLVVTAFFGGGLYTLAGAP